jgi:hypothetical protein
MGSSLCIPVIGCGRRRSPFGSTSSSGVEASKRDPFESLLSERANNFVFDLDSVRKDSGVALETVGSGGQS